MTLIFHYKEYYLGMLYQGKTFILPAENFTVIRQPEGELTGGIWAGRAMPVSYTHLECRMAKELERLKVPSFAEYLRLLRRDRTGDVAAGMVNQLTTNYTYFLREPAHFSLLEQKIYPELFPRKYGPCQIWCAGCATGEECYTLAMSLCDYQMCIRDRPGTVRCRPDPGGGRNRSGCSQ